MKKKRHLLLLLTAAIVATSLWLSASLPAVSFKRIDTTAIPSNSIKGLRDCVVWVRGRAGDSVTVEWKEWYAGDSTVNYIYFQSPSGELIENISLEPGITDGKQTFPFSKGDGDYRMEFPGYFYRIAGVTAPGSVPIVIEPAKYHMSFHPDGSPLYFNVPENTTAFTLCGKYYEGTQAIHLFDPLGNPYRVLDLEKSAETLYFDRLPVDSPIPGPWRIEFEGEGKTSFWVDGIPNLFSPRPGTLFVPKRRPGTASFSEAGETAPMGLIGGFLVNLYEDQRIFDCIQYMNLKTFNYYIDHHWREPYNSHNIYGGDNSSPEIINWNGFNWEDTRIDFYRNRLGAQISGIFDSASSWLGTPLTSGDREEFAEFVLAYITHFNVDNSYNLKWFSPWDEPNLNVFTLKEYESLLLKITERLKSASPDRLAADTHILAISSSGFDGTDAGPENIGRDWAEKLYADHDANVDGIAFDYWNAVDLIESWRFRNAVETAAQIISTNDTDGNRDEQIVINQTSMSPGSSASPYDVNTHYGALWLSSAICNAFGSGDLDAFHYFTTVDDPKHMKGLLYGEKPPRPLPYHTDAQPYEIKPMGHAMAMISRAVLKHIVILNSDSLEVDALLTVDTDRNTMGLVVVNKFPRTTRFHLRTSFPENCYRSWSVKGRSLGPRNNEPVPFSINEISTAGEHFLFSYTLEPETLYTFVFKGF